MQLCLINDVLLMMPHTVPALVATQVLSSRRFFLSAHCEFIRADVMIAFAAAALTETSAS